jgi:hypothetical protein
MSLKFLGFKSQQQLDVIRVLDIKFYQNPKLHSGSNLVVAPSPMSAQWPARAR